MAIFLAFVAGLTVSFIGSTILMRSQDKWHKRFTDDVRETWYGLGKQHGREETLLELWGDVAEEVRHKIVSERLDHDCC